MSKLTIELTKVKGSNPEIFVLSWLDVERRTVEKTISVSEAVLRMRLAEGYGEAEIDSMIEQARHIEV